MVFAVGVCLIVSAPLSIRLSAVLLCGRGVLALVALQPVDTLQDPMSCRTRSVDLFVVLDKEYAVVSWNGRLHTTERGALV